MLFAATARREAEDYRGGHICTTPGCRGALVTAWAGKENSYRVWCPSCGAERAEQFRAVGAARQSDEDAPSPVDDFLAALPPEERARFTNERSD
ncbi:MAG: hypothetical protein NUW21_04920 [Elusimicrobia bacterium]|nr:hypothetical protein [Elusimicrobiota bacterium]